MNIPELTDEQILDFLTYLEANGKTAITCFSFRAYFTEDWKFVAIGLPYTSEQTLANSFGSIREVGDTQDALRFLSVVYCQPVTSISIPYYP